ncbi:putative Red chlorophyll catabolite reductase [Quillaja saponaria]|uniref:red chlorophyll catabolite reductase n=1 Tax=Quillaja saponaria TaxID=32244 RepID=A0AAD7PEQ2_QUISA|nr:putative Red chlorophyll catabolite reductase [Quillaja saponaria]
MDVAFRSFIHSPLPFISSPPSLPSSRPSRVQISALSSSSSSSSLMDSQSEGRSKFMEFPFVSAPHKNLMVDLLATVENRFQSQLLPCTLPPDVQYYQNQNGIAQASLQIRSGNDNSPIDFILGSWIHSELPTGGALNITSLSAYLKRSTDAPNFVIELIQSSPTKLVLILDLPPRKDLVLWPDYLQTFYEQTQLDTHRQALEKIPEVQPYFSSSLYIRSVAAPTAIMVRIETQDGGVERMEEIIKNHIDPISKEVLGIWLDHCACARRELGDSERVYLEKRDGLIRKKTIEIDLGSSFPRLFGQEIADRVLGSIREFFAV